MKKIRVKVINVLHNRNRGLIGRELLVDAEPRGGLFDDTRYYYHGGVEGFTGNRINVDNVVVLPNNSKIGGKIL